MNATRNDLLERGYRDVAAEIGEKLSDAYSVMNTPGTYSAFFDVNQQWVGHNMHVVAIDQAGQSVAPLYSNFYERTPLSSRIRSSYRKRTIGFDDNVKPFRWARDTNGEIMPMERVGEFTARLLLLPDGPLNLGVFRCDESSDFLGRLTAFTTMTAAMFDKETFEPRVEVYDLGIN